MTPLLLSFLLVLVARETSRGGDVSSEASVAPVAQQTLVKNRIYHGNTTTTKMTATRIVGSTNKPTPAPVVVQLTTAHPTTAQPTALPSWAEKWNSVPCPGNTQPWHGCDLTEMYYGIPVILISFGRSGSTVTWDTMTSLASPRRGQKSAESTGRSIDTSLEPLVNMNQTEHGKCWIERILCDHQEDNRKLTKQGKGKSKIIGTKWKPFLVAFNHTKAREALEWIADMPFIKVVYSERNPLDITISRYKHIAYDVPSHCFGLDCKKEHESHNKDLVLPFDYMWESMTNLTEETAAVKEILDEFGVERVEVSYERLYYSQSAKEWMKIFRYLGVGPRQNLTKAEVLKNIEHVETHPKSREDAIANYVQVEAALNETDMKKYLTPISVLAEQDDGED